MSGLSHLRLNPFVDGVARAARNLRVPLYLVGGAVRDAVRGIERAHDFDFALADGFDDVVAAVAREWHGTVIPWDVDQTRMVLRQGDDRVTLDFSRMLLPDIILDLEQRDFTVNAMAIALHEDRGLIDPLGGQADLSACCLRMCSGRAFDADPIRMLRAVRFARQLTCAIESRTRDSICRFSDLITRSARERIKREFFMILDAPDRETSLREMIDFGLLVRLFPAIGRMDGVQQSAPHEHMLLEHCLLAVRCLEELMHTPNGCLDAVRDALTDYLNQCCEDGVSMSALLFLAALVHDVGKPDCAAEDGGRIRFHGHDRAGSLIIRRMARDIGLGRKAQQVLSCLVEQHMRILQMAQLERVTERMRVRFVRDCGAAAAGVCLLAIADNNATGSHPDYQRSSRRVRDIAVDVCVSVLASNDLIEKAPLLNGDDIMRVLASGPGPHIGHILRQAAQLEREGMLHDRDEALIWLSSLRSGD